MLLTGLPRLVFSIPYQDGFVQFAQQKNLRNIGLKKALVPDCVCHQEFELRYMCDTWRSFEAGGKYTLYFAIKARQAAFDGASLRPLNIYIIGWEQITLDLT